MPELKNTFKSFKHRRGIFCEQLCAQYFVERSYKYLAHRYKTQFSEIDLVFSKDSSYTLVEVKSCTHDWPEKLLPKKQALRLWRSLKYIQAQTKDPVYLHLAVVDQRNNIKIYENILNEFVFGSNFM